MIAVGILLPGTGDWTTASGLGSVSHLPRLQLGFREGPIRRAILWPHCNALDNGIMFNVAVSTWPRPGVVAHPKKPAGNV